MNRAALALWDGLVALLLLFPLVLGGVWIERPGLKIELAEMSVPVLLLAALAWILRTSGVRVSQSRSAQLLERCSRWWRQSLAHRPALTLTLFCAGVGLLWSLAALRRHWAFESHSYDLGIFTNAIWNLVHGNGYISSVKNDLPLFADHQSPLFWLLAPVFAIFPHAETLLIAQGFGLASGAAGLFAIGRQYAPRSSLPCMLPFLYWLYSPIHHAQLYDFHPEVLMLPLFLLSIAGIQSARTSIRWLGVLALVLALGAKESAGPVAAAIGLAWFLGAGPSSTRESTRRWGVWVGALGVLVFVWDVVAVPRLMGTSYAYGSLYGHLDSLTSLFNTLLSSSRLKFLIACILPLAGLPFLGWPAWIAALPGFLMLFLQSNEIKISIQFHYGIEPAVGLLWACAAALPRVEQSPPLHRKGRVFLAIVLLAMSGRSSTHAIRFFSPDSHEVWLRTELLSRLDPSLTVAASESIVPHLATRRWVSHLPLLERPDGTRVDCVIRDSQMGLWPMTPGEVESLLQRLQGEWRLAGQCGSTQVWQSRTLSPDRSCFPVDLKDCVILQEE